MEHFSNINSKKLLMPASLQHGSTSRMLVKLSEESWTQNSMYKEIKSQENRSQKSVLIDNTSAVTPGVRTRLMD